MTTKSMPCRKVCNVHAPRDRLRQYFEKGVGTLFLGCVIIESAQHLP